MEFCNLLNRFEPRSDEDRALRQEAWEGVVRLIAPVTPHIAESLWTALGRDGSVFDAGWPEVDEKALLRDEVTLVIQVNGKVRGRIDMAPGSTREASKGLPWPMTTWPVLSPTRPFAR
jgi:leucyl-tRNA synthetase